MIRLQLLRRHGYHVITLITWQVLLLAGEDGLLRAATVLTDISSDSSVSCSGAYV